MLEMLFRPMVAPSGRWNRLPGLGLPRPGRGLPWQGPYTPRYELVVLDPAATDVVRQIRSDLETFYRDDPDLDCLSFLVWLEPGVPADSVVVHAREHRLGTVTDASLSRTVRQYHDPRHPKHCHTSAQLTPDNAIEVEVVD